MPHSQRGGDLLQLTGVVEVVQAYEEQRLSPVERAEERVLDRGLDRALRVRGPHTSEERGAVLLQRGPPLGRASPRHVAFELVPQTPHRSPVEELHDRAAEMASGL